MTPYVVTAVEVVSTLATSTMRGTILSHWLNHRAALLVGREAHEGGEMAPSGIAHQADALRVEPEIGRLGAHELDCRFHVVDAARIGAGCCRKDAADG